MLLIALALFVYFLFFKAKPNDETVDLNSFLPLIVLLAKIGFWVLLGLVVFSILSTILAYILYRVRRKNKLASFQLNLSHKNQDNSILINPVLERALRPILGYISGSLLLKDKAMSPAFVLASTKFKKNSLRANALYGSARLQFPDIQAYQVYGTVLYFEDMLRMIRLSVKEPLHKDFINPPMPTISDEPEIQPESTKEMEVRIEQMRNVEGEYLNYKQFEYGDDVRRIVWKIYGKNRELIVRNAEMRNPFASKVEMFASFHVAVANIVMEGNLGKILLNSYKNAIWSLYQSLAQKQEWDLVFVPEQQGKSLADDEQERVALQIVQSNWQDKDDIGAYFDVKKGTVFCIHSLTDVYALEQFLENGGADKFIYMAYLSDAFKAHQQNWLKRLFFFDKDSVSRKANQSIFELPIKKQVLKNEALLSRLLKNYGF